MTEIRETAAYAERVEYAMSEVGLNPLESILRLCAASAPAPWYPRLFAKQTGVDTRQLAHCLEALWLRGLIDKKPGDGESGPAISLTREGERVLLDPEALQRLRTGQPLSSHDRGAIIRQALSGRLRPRITVLLVLLNVFVFAIGYWNARLKGLDAAFLRGMPVTRPLGHLLEQSGALTPRTLLNGQWWRLLTAGFVHIGLLHLAMNMACLYFAGRFIERMWGHVRYLAIYLIAIVGGCVLVAAHPVELTAGASGGVCGLLAAEALWFLFNRRYLPRALLRQARTSFFINLILLVFIGSFKNVSNWGHFGGAAAGALAALLLQLQRFGPPVWRWLALAGFVPLVWYGQYAIERARAVDPVWHEFEQQQFVDRYARPLQKAMRSAWRVYFAEVEPVLEIHPTRRDADKVEAVLPIVAEQQRKLTALADELARAGLYFSEEAEEMRAISRQYALSGVELFAEAERVLRQGDHQTAKDRRALREHEQQFDEWRRKWSELFQ